jgi:hypothetical protein
MLVLNPEGDSFAFTPARWVKAAFTLSGKRQKNVIPSLAVGPPGDRVEWRERLVCSRCGSRNVDMVVTGTERLYASKARTLSVRAEVHAAGVRNG